VIKGMLTTEARRTQVLPESPASIIMRRTKYAYMKAASLLYASRPVDHNMSSLDLFHKHPSKQDTQNTKERIQLPQQTRPVDVAPH
jgi:hypothetical protein